jgi:hypothetical protein
MDTTIVVALVALVASILSAGVSLYGQLRSSTLTVRREAEAVLAKYREPLMAAAYELQGRLYNILELDFLAKNYVPTDSSKQTYALENTLYVVAQYFGWSEILRREIQFLSFSDSKRTRVVAACQRHIVEVFQSDDPALGRPFLVWRGEQRAIGERMITTERDELQCMGYASFVEHQEPAFRRWLARLHEDLEQIADERNPRLRELQHALVDLVRELDPTRLRYADEELTKSAAVVSPPRGTP